ncbi:MAG: hypothetical protein HQK50_12250 [Oligoflexia bacterium]|nr:hypothetical protein [Oligoflexia bacterium]
MRKSILLLLPFMMGFVDIMSSSAQSAADVNRAIRVDAGYFYDQFTSGESAATVANVVVSDIKKAGFNTIFFYAYNSNYGAFYPTKYAQTVVEAGYGRLNILGEILKAAHANGIQLIASFPINDFKQVWKSYSSWRVKNKKMYDYQPYSSIYLLSAWKTEYVRWYQGLVKDFFYRYPDIDGIEAVEGQVDYFWDGQSDYNSAATAAFRTSYPNGLLGDANWKKHRALGLTNLHGVAAAIAHSYGKKFYVVQTWSAAANGSLLSSSEISNGCGFDFDGILNLPLGKRPDGMVVELNWQQWSAEYGGALFTPSWSASASTVVSERVNGRALLIVHIEISPFIGSSGVVVPTEEEFLENFSGVVAANLKLDVYDYFQLWQNNIFFKLP